jgi:hypothetical protein
MGLRWCSEGPGCGLSEEPMSGVRSGHAGLQSRPRVPTRACCLFPFLVVDDLPVDDVGQPASQAAHGFHRGLPGGFALVVVGAAFGGVAQLHDRPDVQHPVDPPVPGPGQAVAGLFSGGGVDRGGAVPGGEPVPVGEAADVADIGEQPRRCGGADAVQVEQCRVLRGDECLQVGVDGLVLLVDALELTGQVDGQPAPGPPDDVAWPGGGDQRLLMVIGSAGWNGSASGRLLNRPRIPAAARASAVGRPGRARARIGVAKPCYLASRPDLAAGRRIEHCHERAEAHPR